MSRLGDLIRTERIRQKLTPKQVARKCGVSESYLMAVEAGTRIIADDQARRILKTIGLKQQTEAEFTLDDIAATVDLAQVQPRMAAAAQAMKQPKKEAELAAATEEDGSVAGSVWLDALQSVLKRVPVMNAVMKPVSYRLVPVENGRIEGANPDKVFFYLAPDDSMRGFRIHKGDVVLTVPARPVRCRQGRVSPWSAVVRNRRSKWLWHPHQLPASPPLWYMPKIPRYSQKHRCYNPGSLRNRICPSLRTIGPICGWNRSILFLPRCLWQ